MKKCSKCQEIKPGDEFGKRKSSKNGLDSRCLKCIKECSKQSADKNRCKNNLGLIITSKICSSCRVEQIADCFGTIPSSKDGLRSECKDCRNIKARLKYETDSNFRENESIRAASIYLKDREYILNRSKQWSKENPDKKIEQRHRRVARLYGQLEFDLPKNFLSLLKELQNDKCAYCLRSDTKLTVEHMIPISRGGKHCFSNVILACTTCNFSKHSKTLEEWLEHNKKLQKFGITSNLIDIICSNISKLIERANTDIDVNEK